jgi:AraC-like DNA-binding protein
MSKIFRVELGGICPWLIISDGNLSPVYSRYVQQPNHYSLFWLEHEGSVSINNRPTPFQAGNIGFIVPGTKFEFQRVGQGTSHIQLTFELIPRAQMVEIEAITDLGADVALRRQEFQSSLDWLNVSVMRGLACALNTLWSIAKPARGSRKSEMAYAAEDLIVERLHTKIHVAELAAELSISHTHLLRLFREEHSSTIQEFIRSKRADLAVQLITTTSTPLKEVAIRSGLSDLHYFNKVIRAETGLSPTALREQATRKNLRL